MKITHHAAAASRSCSRISPQCGALPRVTEIKADERGHFVTKAEIDGSDITVMVDTGASVVALSYEDADEIGLRPHSLDL